jgi:hypothetical protein
MTKPLPTLLTGLGVSCLIGIVAVAQTTPPQPPAQQEPVKECATVEGDLASADGRPLADLQVQLRNIQTGAVPRQERSDRRGHFEFTDVKPGLYVVEVFSTKVEVKEGVKVEERVVEGTSQTIEIGRDCKPPLAPIVIQAAVVPAAGGLATGLLVLVAAGASGLTAGVIVAQASPAE